VTKTIIQFAWKNTLEFDANTVVVDCRVLKNPFDRRLTDEAIRHRATQLLGFTRLVDQGVRELQTNDTIFVGCTHGRHRSWAVADAIAAKTGATIQRPPA
jgi:RNase adaptor protein for sRNA GlmZ degradation